MKAKRSKTKKQVAASLPKPTTTSGNKLSRIRHNLANLLLRPQEFVRTRFPISVKIFAVFWIAILVINFVLYTIQAWAYYYSNQLSFDSTIIKDLVTYTLQIALLVFAVNLLIAVVYYLALRVSRNRVDFKYFVISQLTVIGIAFLFDKSITTILSLSTALPIFASVNQILLSQLFRIGIAAWETMFLLAIIRHKRENLGEALTTVITISYLIIALMMFSS